jgi:antitoxin component HigA of HigAB toxin-antitoxin module
MHNDLEHFNERARPNGLLDEAVSRYSQDAEFVAEQLAIGLMEKVVQLMRAQGISKAQLAREMGVSKAYVTRLFDAPPNLTLHSIARLALALKATPDINLRKPIESPKSVAAEPGQSEG